MICFFAKIILQICARDQDAIAGLGRYLKYPRQKKKKEICMEGMEVCSFCLFGLSFFGNGNGKLVDKIRF